MYKAIIFDFFGVIRTDAYKSWLNFHGYKREGIFQEVVEQVDRGEISVKEFLTSLSEITHQTPDEIFQEMEHGAEVDHQVVRLIEKLHKNYKIALLSNAPSGFIRALLREYELEKSFDEIIISSEVGLIKPRPEIFQLALQELKTEPSEAIFIDDNEDNIKGGESVGIRGLLYTNFETLMNDLKSLRVN